MEPPLCQVAFSAGDLARSHAWYERLGLGFSGGQGPLSGEHPAKMLDLPELEVTIEWLRGQDSMSQIELIHFSRPKPLPLPADWSLAYPGYGAVSFVVSDFTATLHRLDVDKEPFVVTGRDGSRSLWLKDPDGVNVEVLENDPLRRRAAAKDDRDIASIRAITVTVVDLEKAQRFWVQGIGLTECPTTDAFNEFPPQVAGGISAWQQVHVKGDSLIVRLLKPAGSGVRASNRRLCDLGVLNIAVIVDTKPEFEAICVRCQRMGYRFSTEVPMLMGNEAGTRYGHDDQGNSIEIGFVRPGSEIKYGWKRG